MVIGKLHCPLMQIYFFPISKGTVYFGYPIPVSLLCIRNLGERKLIILFFYFLIILKFKYLQTERSLTWTNVQYSAILDLELERAEVVSFVVGLIVLRIEESKEQVKCLMSRMVDYVSDCQSVTQFSRSVMSSSLWPHELQHTRPPCPSPTPGVHSDSCPSSWWCHPVISSFGVPFSSCPQSLPESGSFPMSQLFAWGGQGIGVSALASVFPMNTQDWSPLGWTGWTSLQSKGRSGVFSNTTVQKHQFFNA